MAFVSLEHRILRTTLLPLYNRFMHVQRKKSKQLGLVYEISRTILFYLPTNSHSVHLLWCLGVGIWQELGDMGSVKSTNHPLTQNHWSFKIYLYLYNGLHIVLSLYLIGFRFEIYSCQIVVSRQVEGIEILTVFTIAVSPVYVAVTCNT